VNVGDYVIIWSNELSLTNRLEARVNAITATTLDIKVTAAEYAAAVAEGPVNFSEGFTVVRCSKTPQKIKTLSGISKKISDIAIELNNQLTNSVVTIDNDEVFIIRTNTEGLSGGVFLIDFNKTTAKLARSEMFPHEQMKAARIKESIKNQIEVAEAKIKYLNQVLSQ
jgi:hypothetical protein